MPCKFANCIYIRNVMISWIIMVNAVSKNNFNKSSNDLESRIVGGVPVAIEKFPASAKFYNFGAMCAGTIINSWCILTAAHCFDHNKELEDMLIEVGARYTHDVNGEVYGVLSFVIHEKYNVQKSFACDIALLFSSQAIMLGKKSKKAILVNSNRWMNSKTQNIIVAGWGWTRYGGATSKQGLMETHLSFVSSKECERMHHLYLTPDMFCLYGGGERDTCKGDSGGGVLWKNMVIGVVSHGDGCAKKDKPSVYANVWYFRQWIQSQVKKFFDNVCDMLGSRSRFV